MTELYRHYVDSSIVTFEITAPDRSDWSRRYWSIAATGLPFLIAEVDSAVAGYALCSPWKHRAAYRRTVEDSVYVAPWAARKGIGTALLTSLLTACRACLVREVIAVIVDSGDPGSLILHEHHGFHEVGRMTGVGYKHGRWLDTVLLQRSLQ